MRHDYENQLAAFFSAYLQAVVSQTTQQISPVVTFYDPMSKDEANRIVVMCPEAETMNYQIGSGTARLEIGIKSTARAAKNQLKTDHDAHFDRVAEVRDFLWDPAIVDKANAIAQEANLTGILLNFVKPSRRLHTDVRNGWIYSETSFEVIYYVTAD